MATATGTTKAQAIRDFLDSKNWDESLSPSDIVKALADQGIDIVPTAVHAARRKHNEATGQATKGRGKGSRGPRKNVPAALPSATNRTVPHMNGQQPNMITAMATFVNAAGGIDMAVKALEIVRGVKS